VRRFKEKAAERIERLRREGGSRARARADEEEEAEEEGFGDAHAGSDAEEEGGARDWESEDEVVGRTRQLGGARAHAARGDVLALARRRAGELRALGGAGIAQRRRQRRDRGSGAAEDAQSNWEEVQPVAAEAAGSAASAAAGRRPRLAARPERRRGGGGSPVRRTEAAPVAAAQGATVSGRTSIAARVARAAPAVRALAGSDGAAGAGRRAVMAALLSRKPSAALGPVGPPATRKKGRAR
jgi:hypothetical protein